MSSNDGGPAFPTEWRNDVLPGISLRDYFAAKAMNASLGTLTISSESELSSALQFISEHSYRVADAMLRAREVKP